MTTTIPAHLRAAPLALGLGLALSMMCGGSYAQSVTPLPNAACQANVLQWTWEALTGPVMTDPAGIGRVKLKRHEVFVPESARDGSPVKRIVLFGDMGGMNGNTPPRVHPEVQAVFARADLVLGNIESPITDDNDDDGSAYGGVIADTSQLFNFHMRRQLLRSFSKQFCIDPSKAVYTVANNHAGDLNRWDDTNRSIQALSADGFRFTGVDDLSQAEPPITEVQLGAMKVGVLGWTHVENKPFSAIGETAGYQPWVTASGAMYTSGFTAHRDFTAVKQQRGLSMLIGMPHWDCQFHAYPDTATVAQGRQLKLDGIDLISGAHPSVLQPVAPLIAPLDPANPTPAELAMRSKLAFYSLGALAININTSGKPGLVVAAEVLVDGSGRVLEYTVHPFIQRSWSSPQNLPTSFMCGARTVTDQAYQSKLELVTLDRAILEGVLSFRWSATDTSKAAEQFNLLFPK